jgi:hypothetical protein
MGGMIYESTHWAMPEDLQKQWVGGKGWRQVQLDSQNVFGLVRVLLATVITAHPHSTVKRRRRHEGIGLAKRDAMTEVQVLLLVESVVLA